MPYLVVENGNRRGFKVEVPSDGKVVFGRDAKADISVTDHLCSRRHFEVEASGKTHVLRDLGSSNGTYVNDSRSPDGAELQHGDCIQAGETQLTFLTDMGQGARGLVGKNLGGYRILERIGRGGMGTVYKANQTSLNRTVALKILSPKVAEDPIFVEKFQKEAQAAGRLNHPNIVQVYDVGSESKLHFYSMEYIENGSVQDLATREGKLDPDLALAIVIDAARGLEYAEKKALVHRDIKPDNLMVNAEGVVKIADLGLARDAAHTARETEDHAGEHHEDDEGIFGTPHFIAPEQAMGKNVDTRSDIYSLGASFYRLVIGATPFRGDTVREIIEKQVTAEPTPVREHDREIPASIAQVIEKMMRKDPDERHQSATELLMDLERISAQLEGGGKKGLIIAASVAVVAVAVAVFAIVGRNGGESDEGGNQPKPPVGNGNPPVRPQNNQVYVEALRAVQLLRLENVKLSGANRTEESLNALAARFDGFVKKYEGTEAWKDDVSTSKELLANLTAEADGLRQARVAREEAAKAKAAAAQNKVDTVITACDLAIKGERWGEGASAILSGVRASELAGFPAHQQTLLGKLQTLVDSAKDKTSADRDSARALATKEQFTEALATLQTRLDNLRQDLDPDPRLDDIRALATVVAGDINLVRTAQAAKVADDRAADHETGFAARKAAFSILRRSFEPVPAKSLLQLAAKDLRTQRWKQLIEDDLALIDAWIRVRDGFLARVAASPPDPKKDDIKLPSRRVGNPDVTWRLTKVSDDGFEVKRGPTRMRHKFADFEPTELLARVFSVRPDPSPSAAADEAVVFLLAGQPAEARRRIASYGAADPTLVARIRREAAAIDAVIAIRELEDKARESQMEYLRLLPLLDRFMKDHRDTIAFCLNSNGSTSVFAK